ncbi:MAG: L-2-hydroxycarboxylate dehydrogenase (NAD+) [Candidatus Woesearchaeota archaeon]|jgi:L-2-hydroxycarboxylate dehydrogenase (NAD+)
MKIKIEEIRKICMKILSNLDVKESQANIVLEEYLFGELSGKKSHGLSAFLSIVDKKEAFNNKWKIETDGPGFALINGNACVGQLLGDFAMNLAVDKAKNQGIAMVGMYNMHSYPIPGYYAMKAQKRGMIGVVIDNARSRVAPFGGIDPKLGTNPIGLAIPSSDFVLDMATAERAMGEVRLAKKLQTDLPEGMAMDKEGNDITDPEKFHALHPFGGYKGYGLNLAIEILAGALVNAKMGSKIQSGLDRGFLFIAINPEVFVSKETFAEQTNELVGEVKSSKLKNNDNPIRIPGEKAHNNYTKATDEGEIELDDIVFDNLKALLEESNNS